MLCCLNPDCPSPLNPDGNVFCQSCSVPLIKLLGGRYKVTNLLSSEGGFGRTYLAEDVHKLDESCVVKQFAPKVQGTWALKKAVELFKEEAKRLQELGEHPQIPTLFAYFEQDHNMYLVQQFIDGQNLLKELDTQGIYGEADIRKLLLDLLPVLKLLHERNVIHRDIKPQNIIRCKSDNRLVLIDFGASKQLTATVHTQMGTTIGSHGYSPVEQIKGGKAYPASDLFSLGATSFHLLTGVSPFHLSIDHGFGWMTSWEEYLKSPISSELAKILDKLLKKEIEDRYQSADEVIEDLTRKAAPPPPLPLTQPLAKPPAKPPASPQSPPTVFVTSSTDINLPLNLIVPLVLAIAFGAVTFWVKASIRPGKLVGIPINRPTTTLPAATEQPLPPPRRSLDNLAPGWAIQIKKEVPLKNQISLSPTTFLQVEETKNFLDSDDYDVYLRICPNPTQPKPTPKLPDIPIQLKHSQLKTWEAEGKIGVFSANADTTCNSSSVDSQLPTPSTPSR
ncbi:serine/threonine protein kinase [Anabaena minutissima FACHB-250]|nr:serine/threonine protein kinase [Anabaena minutissima FACHB-250]